MLSKLLSKSECARCRICCSFDSSDLWETPVVYDSLKKDISSDYPELKFISYHDSYLFRMDKEPEEDLYYCSVLNHERGCVLGDNKPFDCRIWPLRIMELDGKRVITLSPVCPVMIKKPLNELMELAASLAPVIYEEADKHPDIVKKYIPNYPVLVTEPKGLGK